MKNNFKFNSVVIIICVILICSFVKCIQESKPTKKEMHKKQIESLFHYDGGPHKNAFSLVSKMVNDPKSIENLGCYYVEDTLNHVLEVEWEFTVKNKFGGVEREKLNFQSDTLGNIIKIY